MSQPPSPPPLRVLHCILQLEGGGAERQLRELAPHLAARGVEIAIFARLSPDDPLPHEIKRFPIRSQSNVSPRLLIELEQAIHAHRPHIIQSWLTQMDLLCGLIAPFHRARWVLTERSSAAAYPPLLRNRLRRSFGLEADLLIANSPSGLAAWGGNGIVIPNGIDLAAVDRVVPGLHRDEADLDGRFVIASVARLSSEKQLHLLVGAIERARREAPNVLLLLLGTGPERAALESLVARRSLASHVRFMGFKPDRLEWIKSADLLVSASSFEGHPNAVLEAAAAGVPMILSDIAEHRAAAGEGAVYVPADERRFAEEIVRLSAAPDLRRKLAAAGRAQAGQFTIEAAADAYVAAYRALANGIREI